MVRVSFMFSRGGSSNLNCFKEMSNNQINRQVSKIQTNLRRKQTLYPYVSIKKIIIFNLIGSAASLIGHRVYFTPQRARCHSLQPLKSSHSVICSSSVHQDAQPIVCYQRCSAVSQVTFFIQKGKKSINKSPIK